MRRISVVALLGMAALAVATSATSSPDSTSGTLRVKAKLAATWKFGDSYCPRGKPVNVACVRFVGKGVVSGLGSTRSTYVKTMEDNGCSVTQFNAATLAVAGKGTITVARRGKTCGPTAPARVGPLRYTVRGGTGSYKGASGSLTFRSSVHRPDFTCGPCGTAADSWSGTLTVPGLRFDVTAPAFTGATSQTVTAPGSANGMEVPYTVEATDAVDGPLVATCTPASGSFFKRGMTTVTCSATDSSGNTGRTQFVIDVK